MGVYGLWRLIDAAGKQVPLETLEGKVLAIDVSIWIHQVLQGYQDRFGNPRPNAHLMGLFHRICKLLYYKIKPVFVFDGGVPMLKKDTIALRRKQKSTAKNKAQQMRTELINNLMKHSAVKTVLAADKQNAGSSDTPEAVINLQSKRTVDDIFKLPELTSTSKAESESSDGYDSDSAEEPSPRKQTKWVGNIHNVDVNSSEFKALPADVRYEILTDLKETRKQSSWGRLHEMPEESNEFSGFQMKRLLKRRLVQRSLESAEKEMGGKTLTLEELEKLLTEQGITSKVPNCSYRVAADSTTRLIYISDKNAYIKNGDDNPAGENATNDTDNPDERQSAGPSKTIRIHDDINEYEFSDEWDSDIEIRDTYEFTPANESSSDAESEVDTMESRSLPKIYLGKNAKNPALTYMLEYSGLTEEQIVTVLEQNRKDTRKGQAGTPMPLEQSDSLETYREPSPAKDASLESVQAEEATKSLPPLGTASALRGNAKSVKDVGPPSPTVASNNKEDAATFNSTDSDSDDFIEIQDAPISQLDFTTSKKHVPQEGIQISFRSDEQMEDDMFADVFTPANIEAIAEANDSGNALPSDRSCDLSPKMPGSDRSQEDTSIEIITVPETPVKSSENLVNGQRVPDENAPDYLERSSASPVHADTNSELERKEKKDGGSMEDAASCVESSEGLVDTGDRAAKNDSREKKSEAERLPLTESELISMQSQLEDKQSELLADIGKLERQGIDISDQIRSEAQELLRLFGIPYVVAPMEAEAQCAYLEQIRLTDGTITDDSDIWLFGGQCVYKNFFDNSKRVLEFRSGDIQHHFKLSRSDMIRLAVLVGSDYTTGLAGIGPVTALEILAAFPSDSDDVLQGLVEFCSWLKAGRCAGPGRATLRNKLQNLQVQKGFPSQAVAQAYLFPKVDDSRETFSWGKPNDTLLLDYVKRKFGWDKNKYSKIMAPVLKRMEEKRTQNTIEAYFKLQTVPKSIEMTLSKRVKKAVEKLSNENPQEAADPGDDSRGPQPAKKKKSSGEKRKTKKETRSDRVPIQSPEAKNVAAAVSGEKNPEEYIPQREKDKANALKKKLHAIEVLRKSKQGLCKTKKVRRCARKVKVEAELSESDSSSS